LILGDSFETAVAHVWNATGASDCPPLYRDPIDAAGPEAFARKHGALAGSATTQLALISRRGRSPA